MIRGTTPTLCFKIPYKEEQIELGYVTFSRKESVFMDIPFSDSRVTIEDGYVYVTFSQEDTLKFNSRASYSVQLRILLRDPDDSSVANTAVASNIITISVGSILKNGVI